MENNNLPDNLIDDFIMGLLNKEEDKQFRQGLQKDNKLAERVKIRRDVINGIEAFGRKDLKNQLKVIHKEVIGQKASPAKRRSLLPYLAAAASILILVMAVAYLMNQGGVPNSQELYASYFKPYDISGAQRSEGNEQLIQLEKLYANQKYAEALPLLEIQLNADETKSSDLLLAAGISNLELNQSEKALSYFNRITAKGDFNFEDEVRWYSALAYLKQDDITKAKELLEILSGDASADHSKEAKRLLDQLK